MRFQRVLRAIDEIRAGRMVILVDDEDRENEGDLTMAAEKVTPEAINFMARHGRGLICLTLTEERIARLQLPMMVADNRSPMGTAFTVALIPYTLERTNLDAARPGTRVNLEVDVIAKYVERLVKPARQR